MTYVVIPRYHTFRDARAHLGRMTREGREWVTRVARVARIYPRRSLHYNIHTYICTCWLFPSPPVPRKVYRRSLRPHRHLGRGGVVGASPFVGMYSGIYTYVEYVCYMYGSGDFHPLHIPGVPGPDAGVGRHVSYCFVSCRDKRLICRRGW